VRVGSNVGLVLDPVDGAPFGAAINATARVMARARGGEILVSDMARRLAGTVVDVSFRDCGEISLKGFDERWRLYDVVWREPEAASPAPRGRLPSARLHRRRPGLEGAAFGARELAL